MRQVCQGDGLPSTPAPSPEPGKPTLVVSHAVGTGGLRLRKTPSLGGALVKVLPAGTRLTVLEPAGKAKAKVGKANQWVQVREPGGSKGYVGAAYVKRWREPISMGLCYID